jgi:hypothetical protein
MNHDSSNHWQVLASSVVHDTQPVDECPPFGFSTRVVAQWREIQRCETLRFWSRWSLRAAISSVAVCAVVAMFGSLADDSPGLFQPPSADFITPPLATP